MRRLVPLLLALFLVRCGGEDEGRSCVFDDDCGADQYCDGVSYGGCGDDGEEGTCRPLLGDGDECASAEVDCREGLICHRAYDPPVCKPLSPVGGPCRDDYDCDPAPWGTYDLEAAVCDTDASPPACVPGSSIPAGGSCRVSRACAAPNGCIGGVCRGPGAEGETCLAEQYLADGRRACLDGLYCSREGSCVAGILEGEPCWASGQRCAEGLFCYSQAAVCRRPLAGGEACNDGDRCADDLFCSSRRVCSAPLAEGEGCWRLDRCAEGLFCYSREAVCHGPLAEGEACEPGHDVCAPGLHCEDAVEVCAAAD